MSYTVICNLAEKLKSEYKTADPVRICSEAGICLLSQPMGSHGTAIKGFVIGVDGVFTVVVNSDLPDNIQRVIIAHEICHAMLHCSGHISSFSEKELFNDVSQNEREANLFAAELLLDDNEVLESLKSGESFFDIAARLYVPAELLDFKILMLRSRGCEIPELPICSHNDFLRSIKTENE